VRVCACARACVRACVRASARVSVGRRKGGRRGESRSGCGPIDSLISIPDAESLPLYRVVLKLACVCAARARLGLGKKTRVTGRAVTSGAAVPAVSPGCRAPAGRQPDSDSQSRTVTWHGARRPRRRPGPAARPGQRPRVYQSPGGAGAHLSGLNKLFLD
jgi:hypothetical protein